MSEIERTLRRGANTPHTKYNKDKTEGHKLEIQEILDTLNAPSSSLNKNFSVGECDPHSTPVDSHHDTATTPVSDSGTSLTPSSLVL